MGKKRKQYSPQFKAKVAIEALQGMKTVAELSSHYDIHPTMINSWKRQLTEGASDLFDATQGKHKQQSDPQAEINELYRQIGQLKVERDFLAEPLSQIGLNERKALVDEAHPHLSLVRQCQLLRINRSSLYYRPVAPSEEELALLRLLDQQYLQTPFYGSRRMTEHLRQQGYQVNRKRVRRLMHQLGLQAIYPKPKLSTAHPEHKIYPYLLREVEIVCVNQVWSTDITYLPVLKGHFYLVAIMDWYSRKVLSWRVSNTMDVYFCIAALEEALSIYSPPQIFNSDQGAQFTANAFTERLKHSEIEISMDGRGRCHDNIFIERLWRSVKWELIYLKAFEDGQHLMEELKAWFNWYNRLRPHQSLNYRTPDEIYYECD
ncbi:MAG: IS3 family transposase [Leptolyngbyaceae cyanobacterium MO_188.B28]|nr:IS3 family transposase [Leptolyngbyaceae cyanobacterium MO_188.B28]